MEFTAKEHAGYNAAFMYHCTYSFIYGANPDNKEANIDARRLWRSRNYNSED